MKDFLPKLKLILSMFIFGTIGIFVKFIPLPSSVIAICRGAVGAVFLIILVLVSKQKFSFANIKTNIVPLLISGAMLGFNWMLLFEAYNYTTVATATLCYYAAPVFMIIMSPFLFKEKITARKIICICAALCGMVFISGIFENGLGENGFKGIIIALASAVLYALIVVTNKKMKPISAYERTISQLIISAVIMLPYVLLTTDFKSVSLDTRGLILLLVVCFIHTGVAYAIYFGTMASVNAQSIAILSYIDPVVAVLLSVLFLKEDITLFGIIGAILIISSAIVSELPSRK